MAFSRITYNSKSVDFPTLPQDFQPRYAVPTSVLRARSGKTETLYTPRVDAAIEVPFLCLTDADLQRQLRSWWAWALLGRSWTFALDSTKTVRTTVTAKAAAGATSVVVADPTGIATSDRYLLRDGPFHQIVKVTSIA